MIELPAPLLTEDRRWSRWFPPGTPGPPILAEHLRATGVGRCWADDTILPYAVAVSVADQVLLSGDPHAVTPDSLAPLAHSWVAAPSRFRPLLGAAFDRVVPWERTVWVHCDPAGAVPVPTGITMRRLHAADAPALRAMGTDFGLIAQNWGGPMAAATLGHSRGAFARDGRLLSVACTRLLGSRHEEIAVVTVPEDRGRGLALACVAALCADVAGRGRTASWACSLDNLVGRRLAWRSGFRLAHQYLRYATGEATTSMVRAGSGSQDRAR